MSRSPSGNPPAPPHGRVLLIEDHPVLRQLLSDLLVQDGYSVQCATTQIPTEAFDIILTDWLVPGLEVAPLVEEHLAANHHSTCVVMSGYPVNLDQFPAALRPRLRYLPKPFSASQLAECLRGLHEQLFSSQVR
jgi:DNA-binding response OmpR family regulator